MLPFSIGVQSRRKAFILAISLTATTWDFNLYNAAIANGWNGVDVLFASVTNETNNLIGATTASAYAFDTGAGYPNGSVLSFRNKGKVYGRGGASGGGAGGPALRAQYPISINNQDGIIGGGGNGGGTGSSANSMACNGAISSDKGGPYCAGTCVSCTAPGGAGGQGAGSQNNGVAQSGSSGGICGDGVCGVQVFGGTGGTGGALGTGGAAVAGNGNITWQNNGTRYGAIT
ncbi:hypothetical protein [Ferrovibrio sp.]|uniref:hypothetical protein n=1 Tax=Ferrovibrio sp. TaxID=1917215 RepID=UPI0035B2C454